MKNTFITLAALLFFLNSYSQHICAGAGCILVVCADSTIQAWGYNGYGTLGDSTIVNRLTPVPVANLTGVVNISSSQTYSSFAIKSDGTAWGWGHSAYGEFADTSTINRLVPAQIMGLSNVKELYPFFALLNDGTVWAWGDTLGHVPVQVSGLPPIKKISYTGFSSFFGIANDGSLWGWGDNYFGELGDGTFSDPGVPEHLYGMTNVKSVVSFNYTLYLKNDGTVWYSGIDMFGFTQYPDVKTPVHLTALSGITAITGTEMNALALKNDGTVWRPDNNNWAKVAGLSNVIAIASGTSGSLGFSIALKSDGTLWGWGSDNDGQLGTDSLYHNIRNPLQLVATCLSINKTCYDSARFALYPDLATPHHWYALNQSTGTGPLSYSWNWGDGSPLSTSDTASHTYDSAGYYHICVTVTDSTGCSNTWCDSSTYVYKTETSMVTINVVRQLPVATGVSQLSSTQATIPLYPNPTSSNFIIETLPAGQAGTGTGVQQLQLFDMAGKLLLSQSIYNTKTTINASQLSAGIYLVSVKSGEGVATQKLSVVK